MEGIKKGGMCVICVGESKSIMINKISREAVMEVMEKEHVVIVDDYANAAGSIRTELSSVGYDINPSRIVHSKKYDSYEDRVIKSLLPESGKIVDYEFGPPQRLKSEPREFYVIRRKLEKHMLKMRVKQGISSNSAQQTSF